MFSLLFASVGAVLYRLGGTSFGTKYRDWGIPTCMIWYFLVTGVEHWSLCLCWLFMFGAQTTYFKKKGSDAKWFNWLFVGLAFSLSMLPYSIAGGDISGFLLRGLVVTLFTVLWSELVREAWIEEAGRGFIQIITLSLL
jgi:hypothetical protein